MKKEKTKIEDFEIIAKNRFVEHLPKRTVSINKTGEVRFSNDFKKCVKDKKYIEAYYNEKTKEVGLKPSNDSQKGFVINMRRSAMLVRLTSLFGNKKIKKYQRIDARFSLGMILFSFDIHKSEDKEI